MRVIREIARVSLISAAIAGILSPSSAAAGEQGWLLVDEDDRELSADAIAEGVERAIARELPLFRSLRPRKARVEGRAFVDQGPRGRPRLSFTAHGPLRISVDIVVDLHAEVIVCEAPARTRGVRYTFDLRDSEDKLLDYLAGFTLELCVVEVAPERVTLQTRTFVERGPKHRRGFVSMVLHPIVRAQTDELVDRLASRALSMARLSRR